MKNLEIAKIFFEIADILEIQNVEWKPQAYRKAARSIEALSDDIEKIYQNKGQSGLEEISGIGENLARKIAQYIELGKIDEYERLKKTLPKGMQELMHVQGIGPKKAAKLYKELKITTLKKLETAARLGKIKKIQGFGKKSEQDILRGAAIAKKSQETMLLGDALLIAREIIQKLKTLNEIQKIEVAGSLRRRKETVRDIDIIAASTNPKKVMDFFTTMPNVKTVLAHGNTKSAIILSNGIQADLRVIDKKAYGAALQYFSGNKDHNIKLRQIAIKKGYKLSEYGIFFAKTNKLVCSHTEKEVYQNLGMQYIAPELRENNGEIEAAQQKKLPELISYDAICGDLHMHTKYSDGTNTPDEMICAAIKMGYEYIAITDHSKSEYIANGMKENRLLKYISEIEKLKKKYSSKIKVFAGSEVSILPNGELDYSNNYLKKLDWVVASVHSGFKQTKQEMTQRILKALNNKYVHTLGHPTGRLVNAREPYDLDLAKIFQKAKEQKIALEINASPQRLDLKDSHIKTAKEIGTKFVINTDSHNENHLKFMEFGIAQARRGWLEAKNVINTLPLKKFEKEIAK